MLELKQQNELKFENHFFNPVINLFSFTNVTFKFYKIKFLIMFKNVLPKFPLEPVIPHFNIGNL